VCVPFAWLFWLPDALQWGMFWRQQGAVLHLASMCAMAEEGKASASKTLLPGALLVSAGNFPAD